MYRSTCFQWGFYDPQMSGSIAGTDFVPDDRVSNSCVISEGTSLHLALNRCSLEIIPPSSTEDHFKKNISSCKTYSSILLEILFKEKAKGYTIHRWTNRENKNISIQ